MHPSRPLQPLYGFPNLATRKLLDHILQIRSRWRTISSSFMLPRISDQENAVVWMKPCHKVVHPFGGRKRTLVDDIERLFAGAE